MHSSANTATGDVATAVATFAAGAAGAADGALAEAAAAVAIPAAAAAVDGALAEAATPVPAPIEGVHHPRHRAPLSSRHAKKSSRGGKGDACPRSAATMQGYLGTIVWCICGWIIRLSAAQCTLGAVPSSIATGGNTPKDRLAITPDGLKLISTSIDEDSGYTRHLYRSYDISPNGTLTLDDALSTYRWGEDYEAAPVTTSRDGMNVYIGVSYSFIYLYQFSTSDISSVQAVHATGSKNVVDFHYLGMTSNDALLIVVDGDGIYRLERSVLGALADFDQVDEAGTVAATADPTGNYVVVVSSLASVKVFNVGAGAGEDFGSIQSVPSTASGISAPSYISVSPDSIGVYIEGSGGEVIKLNSSDENGTLTLGSYFNDEVVAANITFVAISPNGATFYGLNQATGDLTQYARAASGDLGPVVCNVVTAQPDAYNYMLPSPDGRHIFVADGESLHTFEVIETPSPAPAPVLSTASPTVQTCSNGVAGIESSDSTYCCPVGCQTCGGVGCSSSGAAAGLDAFSCCASLILEAGSYCLVSNEAPCIMDDMPSPTPGPNVAMVSAPDLESAVLSDTQRTLSLQFNSTCFCSEVRWSDTDVALCGYNIVSEEFDKGCAIERVLDEDTRTTFGNQSTCEWSEDSLTVVITYDDAYVGSWDAGANVTLADGYILGGMSSASGNVMEYSAGTVPLQGRTTPPELLEAKFSNDGGSIIVAFAPESSASSGLLDAADAASGSGPGSCETLLNTSAIGEGATCEWTGEREVTITPGFDASITPGTVSGVSCLSPLSCIILLHGGVRTEALAILSSEGSTPVLAPDNPSGISASLVAPQTVGLCGTLKLDGRASSGALSRTLSAFWNVSAASGTSRSSIEASLALFEGSLVAEVNVTALEPGAEFTFALSVENFLGVTNEATVVVTRVTEDVPSVSVRGSAASPVKRSRRTSLRMEATAPACGDSQLMTYAWSEVGGAGYDELGSDVFQDLEGRNPTQLSFPEYTLGYPGSIYLFAATATSQLSGTSATTTVEVTVRQGDLQAIIQGGQFRSHGAGNDLVLDGSASLDEDDITELDWRYEWWCSQNCTSQDGWNTSADGSVVVIPAEGLEPGLIYQFSMNASKGSINSSEAYDRLRWDTASVTVEVGSLEAPEVDLVAKDYNLKHNPSEKVVIYGFVPEQTSSSVLQWTQTEGDLNLEDQEWGTFFTTAQTGTNLAIRSGTLSGGSTYTFRLSATDMTSQATGFAELSLTINAAPSGGHIEASPRVGTAAIDTFVLESLDWTDEVEDLPLMFSFSYNNQEESRQQRSLSVLATESPEWQGPLPLGPSSDNYTMLIIGHVFDNFGAASVSTSDATGMPVTVRITGWTASNDSSTIIAAYQAAHDETADTPGEATSTVRAHASLLVDQFEDASLYASEEIAPYQGLMATMVQDAADDFEVLEYSTTTAGALLDTMVLVSGSENLRTSDLQEGILLLSAGVLERAVEEDSWDSNTFSPTLELLDNVIGGYNASSAGVVGKGELGDVAVETLPAAVRSIALLMTSGLEDGEDAVIVGNAFIDVLCLVTSKTTAMSFDAGSSSVSVPDGSLGSTAVQSRRRRLATSPSSRVALAQYGGRSHRRRMDTTTTTSVASTIIISNVQFNANGHPSSEVEAGVTSITITDSGDGEDIPLSAPVQMTMRATVATTSSSTPLCAYYDENTGRWEENGLVTEGATMSTSNTAGLKDLNVTCWSFHLSDFTIIAEDIGASFEPVELTAGIGVVLRERDISKMGVLLLLVVLLLLAVVRTASRMADGKTKLNRQLARKTDDLYLATGKSRRRPSLTELIKNDPLQSLDKEGLDQESMRRFQSLGCRIGRFLRLLLRYHPWFGIVSPSSSYLPLNREQLSLLIFAQILVHMLVKASFISNSTSLKVSALQTIVSLAVSMPASIVIPKLFAAASAPPTSVTLKAKKEWTPSALSASQDLHIANHPAEAETDKKARWLREPNSLMAVCRLISSAVSSPTSRVSPAFGGVRQYSTGEAAGRGTNLVWSGLLHAYLDLGCMALVATTGFEDQLGKALIFAVAADFCLGLFALDALLSTRGSSFSILNFRTLFSLLFGRVVLTAMQTVLAFRGMQNNASFTPFYGALIVVSAVKILSCYKMELVPCMDAVNERFMFQMSMGKKYHLPRKINRSRQNVSTSTVNTSRRYSTAAVSIQTLVRMHQAHTRAIRHQEVAVWHGSAVESIRKRVTFRAYTCLIIYTASVAWINLCYVVTYDAPAIRSLIASVGITVLVDVLLRNPLSVLGVATLHFIRDAVRVPESGYGGNSRP